MSNYVRVSAFPAMILATLTACGGGGGGGGSLLAPPAAPAAGPEVTFSSFSAVQPNTTTVMPGISRTGRGSANAVQLDPVSTNSVAKLNIGPDGKVTGMSLLAPASSVVFAPGSVNCRPLGACAAGDTEKTGVVLNPATLGWDYQTFGIWAINGAPLQVGAISAGAVTPANAVPTTGSATFTGHAGGFYFDGAGARLTTDAQMSAIANFSNRSIQFSTTGTMVSTPENPPVTSARPALNLSGNLSYAPGSSQFSGNVSTADNALSGNASGRFYGPNAQEIGGVYGLNAGSGGARMIGGFGGKR
jgi:hypothetical protein